jgi:hypothetical protein
LRNWLIGFYIIEYEQFDEDRAKYGKQLYEVIAERLTKEDVKSIMEWHLYICKDIYKASP